MRQTFASPFVMAGMLAWLGGWVAGAEDDPIIPDTPSCLGERSRKSVNRICISNAAMRSHGGSGMRSWGRGWVAVRVVYCL